MADCRMKSQMGISGSRQNDGMRHIWEPYMEQAEDIRQATETKASRATRAIWSKKKKQRSPKKGTPLGSEAFMQIKAHPAHLACLSACTFYQARISMAFVLNLTNMFFTEVFSC